MIGGEEKRERERERERDYEVSKMSFDVNIIYGLYNEYQMKQKIWILKYRNLMWLFYQRWHFNEQYLNVVPMSIY